ncbi:MAG: hypothetical protein MAG453_00290 [Calditrichaeota bacterium]|nr:hypothetical protein [Calditrichota bacterium]
MSDRHDSHILPVRTYLMVAGALFVLTVITVIAAQYDFGSGNVVVAMLIAAGKGSLVALFFMHLKYDNKLYASFFVASLVFLAAFITLTMFDTERRDDLYPEVVPVIREHAVIYDESGKPLKQKAHGEENAAHGDEGAGAEHAPADEGESGNDAGNGHGGE